MPVVLALASALLVALVVWATGWLDFDAAGEVTIASGEQAFAGRVETGDTRVELALLPVGVRWTAPVDPATGRFEVVFPVELAPGNYALYVDDALAQEFVVADDGR